MIIYLQGLSVKVGNKYLCWNSFKGCWFWGPRNLSEIFVWGKTSFFDKIKELQNKYPYASIIEIRAKNY